MFVLSGSALFSDAAISLLSDVTSFLAVLSLSDTSPFSAALSFPDTVSFSDVFYSAVSPFSETFSDASIFSATSSFS